jgi:LemA protein
MQACVDRGEWRPVPFRHANSIRSRADTMITITIILAVVVLIGLWALVTYNGLVRQKNVVAEAWSGIDAQLKRRTDLIPNLVETVKGYAAHERGTLEAVIAARNAAAAAGAGGPGGFGGGPGGAGGPGGPGGGPAQQAQAEGYLTQTLGRLFALAEAYPDLKANQNFLQLQGELGNTEEKIAYARQFYNSAVQTYNQKIQTLPTNLIAGVGGFQARPYFQAAAGERTDVDVRF